MEKIKQFFKSIWAVSIVVMGVILAVLSYLLNQKNRTIDKLQAEAALVKTKEQIKNLESEIISLQNSEELTIKERTELTITLQTLEKKKKQLLKEADSKTAKEIEDFWNT